MTMSEKVHVTEECAIVPFALQFIEVIPRAELEGVSGQYNDKLQVWEIRR